MLNLLNPPINANSILQHKRKIKRTVLEKNTNFIEKRIAILSGSTIGEFADILELFLLNNGIKPVFFKGNYNRFYEDAIYNTNELIDFNPDIVYIHTSCRNIVDYPEPGDNDDDVSKIFFQQISKYEEVWNVISEKLNAVIIQNNFEMLPYRALGNSEVYRKDGMLNFINLMNERIYEYANEHNNFYVNDIAYMASYCGLRKWFDEALWYAYKYPFSLEVIPYAANNLANIIKSLFGKNKRSIVVDLDNTLWGGVIGDCGKANISIGYENPNGMAYTDFQKYLKRIQKSGVNLNICSKNYQTVAEEGFSHPGNILCLNDFICKYINWDSKDKNIRNISIDLNTSLNNMVFIDDNQVERDIVRTSIADICIPEIKSVEEYIHDVDIHGYFEAATISDDDLKRNEYYKNNIKRQNNIKKYESYEEYLLSLDMECIIMKINDRNIQRVLQLINKTNQFNLTTKRYTINELQSFINDSNTISFCASLQDKFGDNGVVSTLLAKTSGQTAIIELWIMSCRVFNRDLEYVVFSEFVRECEKNGISSIEGIYIPTEKNKYVENLYKNLGFSLIQENNNSNTSKWRYNLNNQYEGKSNKMRVIYDQ